MVSSDCNGNYIMGKVNGCPHGIGLEDIFRNFYRKRKKQLTFLTAFYIFHDSGIKTSLKWSINKCRAPVNKTLILYIMIDKLQTHPMGLEPKISPSTSGAS